MKNLLIILITLFLINNAFAGEKEPGFFPIPSDVLNDIKGNFDRIRQEKPNKNILLYLPAMYLPMPYLNNTSTKKHSIR